MSLKCMGGAIKPVKSIGTRWIDHQIHAVQHLVDKYTVNLCITQFLRQKKPKHPAYFKESLIKLIDAKVLLQSCFFVDALSTAKWFNLTPQKADIDIISITENVESTKNSYEKLLRKFESNGDKVLSLPTPKSVIKEIESNKDGEPVYQGQKLKYYSREIQFLKNHRAEIIKSFLSCYAERNCNLYSETTTDNPISDGDTVLFDPCCVLNTTAWPQSNDSKTRMKKLFQFSSLEPIAILKDSSPYPFLNLLRAHRYKVGMQILYATPISTLL